MKSKSNPLRTVAVLFIFFFLYAALTALLLFISKDIPQTLTRSWKEYYSINDWDRKTHAIVDIDGDGNQDMITIPNFPGERPEHCAFLSQTPVERIPETQRCERPGMTYIIAPDQPWTGQKLQSSRPFRYDWLSKSYLVKTQQDRWRFYDMNGLQMRVFEKNDDGLFEEKPLSFLDRIDVFTYQISHLGVTVILFAFWLVLR